MSTKAPSAASSHEVLIGIAALLVFVIVGVTLAGFSDTSANLVIALFAGLLFLQLLTNASLFNNFLSAHPIITNPEA